MDKRPLPLPQSGGIILSYQCSAACRHCMCFCSPSRQGDWFDEEKLIHCLSLLAGRISSSPWGHNAVSLNQGLHFTGGEPFLNYDLLLKAVKFAAEYNIPSTFVETNGFWCTDDKVCREQLRTLKETGLKGISISVNPFLTEYIPFECTERCIRISQEIFAENVMVYQMYYYRQFKQMGIRSTLSLEEYHKVSPEKNFKQVEMMLMGRANRSLRNFYLAYPAETFFQEPCISPVLRNWHNHFDNYGNLIPGYCGGISLGNWRDFDRLVEEGLDLEQKPVLRLLVSEDIEGLYYFARDYGFQEDPQGYLSKCDLCFELRSFLVGKNHFEELNPLEFYRYSD